MYPLKFHPIVKDTVGWRLAQLALGKVYGKKTIYQGPEFKKLSKSLKNVATYSSNNEDDFHVKYVN